VDFGVVAAAGLAVMISRSSSKFADETSADTRISGPSLGALSFLIAEEVYKRRQRNPKTE
jgi:hypothetical protein